mmetsp:Transcript_22952/g.63706  ORF Transcript_22952/g.63706 Transcript_22952/m.63706 type:complete len:345 (+) Transcript_22952:188-1222(+)|eukprot:CAMPEP_0117668742 /NCGR_PEP_ID=MMETSP0804-20121206/11726_1 /TAXON_ID=1074897 /ORGANISM="Tetraselmis astigmatica, Strain CCMP880" /LENGTH=344 /DNA_ID=CAMNT_0005476683 /DNA_START=76 /DNA_END=1110 /DNA_ORIENTATION=+
MDDNPFQASDNPFQAPANDAVAAVPSAMSDVDLGNGLPSTTGVPAADENPFSAPAQVIPPTTAYSSTPAAGAYGGRAGAPAPPAAIPNGRAVQDLSQKEQDLARREAELAAREHAVHQLEIAAANNAARPGAPVDSQGRVKNWPWGCPVIYHNINEEIPTNWIPAVTKVFWSYLGLMIALIWNFVGVTAYAFGAAGDISAFFMAAIYAAAAIPGALFLWYLRLYNATMRDRAITFGWFFLMYLIHVAFCFWAAVAPPLGTSAMSFTGVFSTLKAFNGGVGFGVMYIIGTVLWGLEALWSLLCFQQTYSQFRAGGGQAQLNAQMNAASQAANAVTNYASSAQQRV